MPVGPTTLDSLWRAVAGQPIVDDLLDWPPDVFALTEVVLEQTEAYRFVVSPPAGEQWPPPDVVDWAATAVATGAAWTASAGDDGRPPTLVADAWDTVRNGANTPLDAVASGDRLAALRRAAGAARRRRRGVRRHGRRRRRLRSLRRRRPGAWPRAARPHRVVGACRSPGAARAAQGAHTRRRHLDAVARPLRLRAPFQRRCRVAQGPGAAFRARSAPAAAQPRAVAVAAARPRQRLPPAAAIGTAHRTRAVRLLRVHPGRAARPRSRRPSADRGPRRGRCRRHRRASRERRSRRRDRRPRGGAPPPRRHRADGGRP